jgi:uncharacterized protein
MWKSVMKTAAQLLNEFLPLARNPKEAAALFAEDGVGELPYLADLGMRWQYKGRAEIASLYALLLHNWLRVSIENRVAIAKDNE